MLSDRITRIAMTPSQLSELDPAQSVLFLGSGFSADARNIRREKLPTGTQLRDQFAKILGVSPADYDLKTLADEMASRPSVNLYQTLYQIFTVKELQPYQKKILRLPWHRIYTTNFDDAVEYGHSCLGIGAPSFSYDDEKPKKLPQSAVVHLHGTIRKTNDENVLDQLVLNESAYVRQHFEKSPWYDDFDRDLRFCAACFFLGYSLSDYHITALLMQNPTIRQKLFFVTQENPDRLFLSRVAPYGSVLPIRIDGFADLCHKLPRPSPPASPHSLKGFRYLDPFKDKRSLSPPTAIEIQNLVTYGTFNYERCLSTLPEADYVVPRRDLLDKAISSLEAAKCLLIHSHLGNGKTIFLYILAHRLSAGGYQCFICRENAVPIPQDIELLKRFSKPALLFDSYNTAVEFVDYLSNLSENVKFIVSVRTSIQDVRLHEIQAKLPTPLARLNLNGINAQEINDFKALLDRSGIRADDLEQVLDRCKDFREVVVTLYDHREIKSKIRNELMPLLRNKNFRNVFVASHLLKWIGQDIDAAFLRSVTGVDAYAEIAKSREIAQEVFRLEDDDVQVRSAVFSEYLIGKHLNADEIIDTVYPIIVEAVKRKNERRYQTILSSLMRFSILERALINDPNRLSSLAALFDRLHRDIDVNREPLFWLQYSILMTASDNLPAAENFIRTAYARAAASPGFQTFQIDTYALRLWLMIEQRNVHSDKVMLFNDIIDKIQRTRPMIGDQSRRFHAVQVLNGIEPFVHARISSLSLSERNLLVYHLALLVKALERLSPDERAQTGSDLALASLMNCKDYIVSYNSKIGSENIMQKR
jgi:hypothetical protein